MSRSYSGSPKTIISHGTPEPFIRAEIAAFPIASEEAFRCGLVELDPKFTRGEGTARLWRACEGTLAPHTGWSLDRLVSERDRGWFGACRSSANTVPLHEYLQTLARSYLVPCAGVTEIYKRGDLSDIDAADRYRWLTFTLPEDLLLVALGVDPPPERVDMDPPLLVRRLLDLGVAEIHQHLGAGMDFPVLWASALAAIATQDVPEDALESPGAAMCEGKELVRWLIAAAVARCVMAEYLIHGKGTFCCFVNDYCCAIPRMRWTPRRWETLVAVLAALVSGEEERLPEIEPLRDLYSDLHPTALTLKYHPLETVDEVFQRCDPVALRLGLQGKNAGERWLVRKGIYFLASQDVKPDQFFSNVFWQTIRVRCQYYRTVVQRPLTGGLQWFIRFYERLGALRTPLFPILPQVSYLASGQEPAIKAVEFRTSLGNSSIEVGQQVLDFLCSWQRVLHHSTGHMLEPEAGILFHFVKERDGLGKSGWSSGRPSAFWRDTCADPYKGGMDVLHGRYVDYFSKQCRKAQALAELIDSIPSLLWVIRGVDVAADELGIPTWVLAPLFRHLLDVSAKASIRYNEDSGPPLCVTAHAGEDFLHLLQGMRRVYEQVHYVLGGNKGRLGHAIAMGLDPLEWAQSVGTVLMPAEERLWDLVWEWRMYTQYKIVVGCASSAPAGRINFIINGVRDLADSIYGKYDCSIEELAEVHHILHCFLGPPFMTLDFCGDDSIISYASQNLKLRGHSRFSKRVCDIVDAYLDSDTVFVNGQALMDVPIGVEEVEAIDAVQRGLRQGVSQRGIVVEVNPSSNLLIGDLRDLRKHPVLRLHPPVTAPDSPPSVAIALGSDDPLTFSSSITREYVLLHQAACAAGYAEGAVQEWLEVVRRTGMDARFTKAWRPNAKSKIEELIHTVKQYLHQP